MFASKANVSAILTTYLRPDLAKIALKSILGQSLMPEQIIVVEDGGNSVLDDWITALGCDSITYVRHNRNLGLAAARNTGLRLASCELVAYLDDDDRWLPTRLEEQVNRYRSLSPELQNRLASIQVGCKIVNDQGRFVGCVMPVNQGSLKKSIIRYGPATPSSCFLFVRSALRDIGGFDEDLASGIDHDVWMKLAVAGYSNEIVSKPLVVVTRDDRPKMMSDTKRRVAGIALYIDKWSPTYVEWFGSPRGDIYARRYFISVVGGLAGENFARRRIREGWFATREALRRVGRHPSLMIHLINQASRTFLAVAVPQLGSLKRVLLNRQST